jgi:WW domain-binding protein 4
MNDIAGCGDISTRALHAQMNADKPTIGPQVDPIALPADFWSDEEESSGKSKAKKKKDEKPSTSAAATVIKPKPTVPEAPAESGSMWCEAKTDDGDTYYWNVKTNESVWEPPKEGYMSYEEYQKINRLAYDKQEENQRKASKYEVDNAAEIAAKLKREQVRDTIEYYNQFTKQEQEDHESEVSDVPQAANPYGSWEVVQHR